MYIIDIRARRTGKTTELLESFLRDRNESSYFLVNKNNNITNILSVLDGLLVRDEFRGKGGHLKRVISVGTFLDSFLHGAKRDHYSLYLDEYLSYSFDMKHLLYRAYERGVFRHIQCHTTSNMLYKTDILNLVKCAKENHIIEVLMRNLLPDVAAEIRNNYIFNFLTEADFVVRAAPCLSEYPIDRGEWCE